MVASTAPAHQTTLPGRFDIGTGFAVLERNEPEEAPDASGTYVDPESDRDTRAGRASLQRRSGMRSRRAVDVRVDGPHGSRLRRRDVPANAARRMIDRPHDACHASGADAIGCPGCRHRDVPGVRWRTVLVRCRGDRCGQFGGERESRALDRGAFRTRVSVRKPSRPCRRYGFVMLKETGT